MNLIKLLKKMPLDLGQGNLRKTTKGKLIALEWIKKAPGRTALDIGCREGYQSKFLERKGYQATSIDIEKVYDKCVVVNVDKGLPFPDNSFDLIWCSEVIEHLENPRKSLGEFKRVLKPTGRIILTTPNSYFWLMRIIYLFGLTPRKIQNPGHRHFFNEKQIRKLFPKARIYGYFPYILLKFKIRRLIGLLSPTFVIKETKY